MTNEDLAATAFEDAEIVQQPRPITPARPKIGDTRPAPVVAPVPEAGGNGASGGGSGGGGGSGTGTKRRRRGGRGRGGKGGSAGTVSRAEAVRADLGVGEDEGLVLEELDDRTLALRRGRTRKGKPAGRYQMVVHTRPGSATQIAVLEGRNLVEHYVSWPEDDATSIDGNIYLGRVQNVLPGMEAAFIDIATPKNGVLYRGDVAFDPADVEESQPRIERLLKNGQMIMVQVTKNPIGAKGARLTQEVSLAGRFVVMVPGQPDTYGISKRLPDDERKRLRRILEGLRPPDAGLIVRTAAEGAAAEELERDLKRLSAQWQQISDLAAKTKQARLLYQEPQLVVRVIREEFTKEYRSVVIDDRALYEEIKGYVDAIAPELSERIEYYDAEAEHLPIFERFHVHEQLHKALDRKVWLPSGGSLIIERTEALTVIDVNTGKNVGKSNLEETVFQNNLEAADEIARQLRLRDIGGIIVIDFIDMEIKQNRDAVMKAFRDALARDKTRTQVFDISELGLVEMTRKRISEGLVEAFSETCPTCTGRGFVLDETLLG
ncbi:MAG: Rne/Rng family ribonuclease [Acidimicrobiia bacterium]